MSEAAEMLRSLAARVEEAGAALARADFAAFAEAAADLDSADLRFLALQAGAGVDDDAREACRALRGALDRLGALLGHVAGVQQALRGIGPGEAVFYDRGGSGARPQSRGLTREA